MATKDKGAADAEKVKKDHAKTGKPVGPVDDPTDHSVPAGAIAAKVDPAGKSGATVNAETMDAVSKADEAKEDQEKAEEDNSIAGKLRKTGLFFVHDHSTGRRYVGISPQNDPKATEGSKRLSTVQSLDAAAPRTGIEVIPAEGDSFVVGDGFGPDATPADWSKVTRPDGSLFLA